MKVPVRVTKPGGTSGVKVMPKVQLPLFAFTIGVAVPDWPDAGKPQLVPLVGVAKEKLVLKVPFVPAMVWVAILRFAAPGLVIVTFVIGVLVTPRGVGPSTMTEGLKIASAFGFWMMFRGAEPADPPPGNGLKSATWNVPTVMFESAGMVTSKTVPPAETTPPDRGMLLKVTCVLGTKPEPVK